MKRRIRRKVVKRLETIDARLVKILNSSTTVEFLSLPEPTRLRATLQRLKRRFRRIYRDTFYPTLPVEPARSRPRDLTRTARTEL